MQWSFTRTVLVASVATIAFTGCLKESGINVSNAAESAPAATSPALMRAALPDFSSLVEQVGPAVVNISVTSVAKARNTSGFDENDPFFDFFRRFGIPTPGSPRGEAQPRISQGVGSGFIVSADGYVLTNAHVIASATDVTVRLTDKREFKAKVIGSDARTDVALLKIDAKNLPVVRIGDADKVKAGQWVVAVGSPFGFDNTVTAGIVSAKARRLPDENFVPFIQTDVAINPGNSGGPLFNLDGEVIGINSQIYSRSGGFMGISFSIPIDVAMKVKSQLQQFGKVSRGRLGVYIQPMDKDTAQSFGLDSAKGALISSVEPNGPADKAGLQAGDIITQVNGSDIAESGELPRVIGDSRPGDTVKLKVWRSKASREISVVLGEQVSDDGEAPAQKDSQDKAPSADKLGLTIRALQPIEMQRLNVKGGLVILNATGPSAKIGLRQGDVILGVGNQRVESVAQFNQLVQASGKQIPLLVQRQNVQQFVVVKLD